MVSLFPPPTNNRHFSTDFNIHSNHSYLFPCASTRALRSTQSLLKYHHHEMDESPFIDKLHTNYVPLDEEIDLIGAHLEKPLKDLYALENDISRLRRSLNSLCLKRDKLKANIIAHQALTSLIRRFPREVLAEIFIHCLPAKRKSVMSVLKAPILLGRVCSLWRSVSLSTPYLWSRILFTMPSAGRDSRLLEAAKLWLGRSGTLPLSISIFADLWDQSPTRLREVIQTFVLFSKRWKDVEFIRFTPTEHFMALRARDLPMLESITILDGGTVNDTNGQGLDPSSSEIFAAPRLCRVSLDRYRGEVQHIFDRMKWDRLIELRIQGMILDSSTPPNMLKILNLCPNLVHCSLDLVTGGWDPSVLPHRNASERYRVSLPSLESLSISVSGSSYHTPFFDHIDTPKLRVFQYVAPSEANPSPPLANFVSRCRDLDHLIIDAGYSTAGLLTCLKHLPSELTHLTVEHWLPGLYDPTKLCAFTDEALALLTPLSSPEDRLCPNLQSFVCHQPEFSDKSLLAFIRARETGCLEEVRIGFSREKAIDIMGSLSTETVNRMDIRLSYASPHHYGRLGGPIGGDMTWPRPLILTEGSPL